MQAQRTTGSWIVRRETERGHTYLMGGPFVPGSIRPWFAWGHAEDAYVFPTKKAAREAMGGRSHYEIVDAATHRLLGYERDANTSSGEPQNG